MWADVQESLDYIIMAGKAYRQSEATLGQRHWGPCLSEHIHCNHIKTMVHLQKTQSLAITFPTWLVPPAIMVPQLKWGHCNHLLEQTWGFHIQEMKEMFFYHFQGGPLTLALLASYTHSTSQELLPMGKLKESHRIRGYRLHCRALARSFYIL